MPTDKNDFPVIPDWILPLYGVGILDGLLGKMMSQIAKSYSNPKQGVYHLARFNGAMAQARASALRRYTFGTQAWSFPQGFRTTGQRGGMGSDTRFA